MAEATKPRIRMTMRAGQLVPVKASYEGASHRRRMVSKGVFSSGPNNAVARSLDTLQTRSHHAIRNNAYAHGAKETYEANLVGDGIKPDWKNKAIQKLWNQWVTEADADGESFYGLQSMAVGAQFESGEVFGRFRVRRPTDGLSVPLQIQVMESAHLDPNYSRVIDNRLVKMGIEFDGIGQRTAYHMWRFHPHEQITRQINSRVPVPASNIVHMYRRQRPGQLRGVPVLTPVLVTLYAIDKMQDATLQMQTLGQLFGAFVKRKPGETDGDFPDFGEVVNDYDGEVQESDSSEPAMEFTSGAIHYLEEGEEVTFSQPQAIGSSYVDWLRTELLRFARGVGLTHEQLTGDLKNVNYSSIRAGLLEFRRKAEALQAHMIVQQWCKPIAARWLDTAVVSGAISLPDYWVNRAAYHTIDWIAPKWAWVDPLKEVMADLLEVRAAFKPRSEAASERGWDLESLDRAIAASNESADKNGIISDSDPRKVNKSGVMHTALQLIDGDEPNEEEDDNVED